MNKEYIYHSVAGRNDNAALILLAFWLDFTDFPSLIDVAIADEGAEVQIFCKENDAKDSVFAHECFLEHGEDVHAQGYYNYYLSTPHDFIEAFTDVYKMDHMGGRRFVSCGERLLHARTQASELRPSEHLAEKQKAYEEQMSKAQEMAEKIEEFEKNSTRHITDKKMSADTPLQAEQALKDSIKEEAIKNIEKGVIKLN